MATKERESAPQRAVLVPQTITDRDCFVVMVLVLVMDVARMPMHMVQMAIRLRTILVKPTNYQYEHIS